MSSIFYVWRRKLFQLFSNREKWLSGSVLTKSGGGKFLPCLAKTFEYAVLI